MNKYVIEKLIHAKNLFDGTKKGFNKFADKFSALPHLNTGMLDYKDVYKPEQGFELVQQEYADIKLFWDMVSVGISTATKIFIPFEKDGLTNEERLSVAEEVKMIIPFPNTFIQWEVQRDLKMMSTRDSEPKYFKNRRLIQNLWVMDSNKLTDGSLDGMDDEGNQILTCVLFSYDQGQDVIHLDHAFYDMTWDEKGNYHFWLSPDQPFFNRIDTSGDENGVYSNESLKNTVQVCNDVLFEYNMLTQFPNIATVENVKGLQPSKRPSMIEPRKYKKSTLMFKPTWEHKVLKVNLYDNQTKGVSTGRSGGTRFHGVRKHLRRLPTGKHTFVKAHFRGQKDIGVISKDYQIGNKN